MTCSGFIAVCILLPSALATILPDRPSVETDTFSRTTFELR